MDGSEGGWSACPAVPPACCSHLPWGLLFVFSVVILATLPNLLSCTSSDLCWVFTTSRKPSCTHFLTQFYICLCGFLLRVCLSCEVLRLWGREAACLPRVTSAHGLAQGGVPRRMSVGEAPRGSLPAVPSAARGRLLKLLHTRFLYGKLAKAPMALGPPSNPFPPWARLCRDHSQCTFLGLLFPPSGRM